MAFATRQTAASNRTGAFYEGKELALTHQGGNKYGKKYRNNKHISENKKIEIATMFAVTKNYKKTAELAQVPETLVKKLRQEVWFDQVMAKVQFQQNEALDAKLTEVVHKAAETLLDRLEDGEYVKDKESGQISRIPIKSDSAARILDSAAKQRQLLRGEATSRSESTTESDRLSKLKEQFENLARSKKINPTNEVINHEHVSEAGEGPETWAEAEGEAESFPQEELNADQLQGSVNEQEAEGQDQNESTYFAGVS